eukprot:TRINITY_DN1791_c0_g1_i2.p2 TRINITY_DN1791_c0_g1~~TRINITY_DN1791_c0_g1_i2.p2  ORF type:complete len:218 (-),score=48.24 TRINITY_DN1791_c0_g1_i2:1050-1703(-)
MVSYTFLLANCFVSMLRKKTTLGNKAKEYMNAGKLVPDELVISMTKDRLEAKDCQQNGWLLDGFPRTHTQAKALEQIGAKADAFIELDVDDRVMIERSVCRRMDPKTGLIYNTKTNMPKESDVIKRLITRADDTEEKMKERLSVFHKNVSSVIEQYRGVHIKINGNQRSDAVFQVIISGLEKLRQRSTASTNNTRACASYFKEKNDPYKSSMSRVLF